MFICCMSLSLHVIFYDVGPTLNYVGPTYHVCCVYGPAATFSTLIRSPANTSCPAAKGGDPKFSDIVFFSADYLWGLNKDI